VLSTVGAIYNSGARNDNIARLNVYMDTYGIDYYKSSIDNDTSTIN